MSNPDDVTPKPQDSVNPIRILSDGQKWDVERERTQAKIRVDETLSNMMVQNRARYASIANLANTFIPNCKKNPPCLVELHRVTGYWYDENGHSIDKP